jgi:hypothetical protein
MGQKTDAMTELSFPDRKRVHHLKYYTWIEQQMFDIDELNRQWYDESYWTSIQQITPKVDQLITEFNEKVGAI